MWGKKSNGISQDKNKKYIHDMSVNLFHKVKLYSLCNLSTNDDVGTYIQK